MAGAGHCPEYFRRLTLIVTGEVCHFTRRRENMRNRKVQREMKKRCEEMLGPKNYVGISDPTPYEAVKKIRKLQIAAIKAELRAGSGKEVVA